MDFFSPEIPASENADYHPGPGRRVDLLALEGIPDCLARILARPDTGQAGCECLVGTDGDVFTQHVGLDDELVPALFPYARFSKRRLTEEIVVSRRRE